MRSLQHAIISSCVLSFLVCFGALQNQECLGPVGGEVSGEVTREVAEVLTLYWR